MSETYTQRAEEFLQQIEREYYESGAGLKERLDTDAIYERYSDLFTRDAARDWLARADTPEGRYVADFAALGYLENRVRAVTEEIINSEVQATVEWDGKQIPYRAASLALANEPDAMRRRQLHERILARTDELNPRRDDRWQQIYAAAADLGFDDYIRLCERVRGLDLRALATAMEQLLERTDTLFNERLDHYLAQLGVAREEARTPDLSYLFRAPAFDPIFPSDRLVPALRETLAGLGINPDAQPNVILDVEQRPLKSPRAFCAPIRVPEEIMLVIQPRGGPDDYRAILHEAGHAQHFAHVAADLPFAYRRLGDNSVTEAYAFLFDHLAHNPHWLRHVLGVTEATEYLRQSAFFKLFMLRRYAAKLRYELELHTGAPNAPARYSGLLGRSLGIWVSPSDFLRDVDDAFYVAQYIRAWGLETLLRKHLEERLGPEWFRDPSAGNALKALWGLGQELPAEGIARRTGAPDLTFEPLIRELSGG